MKVQQFKLENQEEYATKGTEIFEGDIVEYTDWFNGEIKRDIVQLRSPRFWLKNEVFGYDGEQLIDPEDAKVIGNIYENPELLEEVL